MKTKLILSIVFVASLLTFIGGTVNTVEIKKKYNHSPDQVWQKWANIGELSEFHPDLKKSIIVSEQKTGLNTHRLVTTNDGKEILHKVVEFSDNEKKMAFTFEADFLPLKYAICKIDVQKVSEKESIVSFRVDMHPKMGFLGWVLGKVVLEKKLAQGGNNLLAGLEKHLTTLN